MICKYKLLIQVNAFHGLWSPSCYFYLLQEASVPNLLKRTLVPGDFNHCSKEDQEKILFYSLVYLSTCQKFLLHMATEVG